MGKCISKRKVLLTRRETMLTASPLPIELQELTEISHLKHIPKFRIRSKSRNLIVSALSKNYLFCELTISEINSLIQKLFFYVAEENQTIITQGSKGSLFFIINSGYVNVIINGEIKRKLEQEDCFGELALLSDSVRKASIQTISKSSFWVLSSGNFFAGLRKLNACKIDKNRKLISSTFLFKGLTNGQIDEISKLARSLFFKNGDKIIEEGDTDENIFILKSGIVSFYKGNQKVFDIDKSGEIFGEGSILHKGKRMASCLAVGLAEVIEIHLDILKGVLGESFEEIILKSVAKSSILSDTYLRFLSEQKVNELCYGLVWKKFKDKDVVILRKYQKITTFRIVCCGELASKDPLVPVIKSYSVIGMGNETERNLKPVNYHSNGNSIIGEIQIDDLNKLLKIDTISLCAVTDRIQLIYSMSFLSDLSLDSVKILCDEMSHYKVLKDTKIFAENDKNSKVYLVRSGTFEVRRKNGTVARLITKNEIFGETCLYKDFSTVSVICVQDGEMFSIGRSVLKTFPEYSKLFRESKRRFCYQKEVNLNTMMVIGSSYSSFNRDGFYIQDTTDNSHYHLTLISKSNLQNEKECNRLVSEKNIMIQVEHKLLMRFVDSSVDKYNIYFISELFLSIPLKNLMPLNIKHANIILVHLIKILEYLHSRDIIYRDLCPENVIISNKSLPCLWNFKNAVRVKNRSYSKVGNYFYRSPEMILGRGYTKATDIWSLGILTYEVIFRDLPFDLEYTDSPVDAYEKILKMDLKGSENKDQTILNFIKGLLCKSQERWDANLLLKKFWLSEKEKKKILESSLPANEKIYEKSKAVKKFIRPFPATKLMKVFYN